HQIGDLTAQGILVQRLDLAIPHHDTAVDDYALHATAGFRVDKLPRGTVVGKIGGVVEVDEDQVRLIARPDGAETTLQARRARVAKRCMAKNLMREGGARLWLADRREQAEQLHRLEHALHVAAAAIVAAQAQPHACFAQVAHRRDAALELHVAEMIEHNPGIGGGHTIHFAPRNPYAVDDVQAWSKETTVFKIADQGTVVIGKLFTRDQHLTPGLVDVGVDGEVMLVR